MADKFVVCNWTGAPINTRDNIYKLPPFTLLPGRPWIHSFCDPGCAIAYVNYQVITSSTFTSEKAAEVTKIFIESLVNISDDSAFTFDLPPTEPQRTLKCQGPREYKNKTGKMTHEEFFATYNHQEQIEKLVQRLPEISVYKTEGGTERGKKCSYHYLDFCKKCIGSESVPLTLPKNWLNVVNSFSDLLGSDGHVGITVGAMKGRFAIYDPRTIDGSHRNSAAEEELSDGTKLVNVPTSTCKVVSKTNLGVETLRKKRKRKSEANKSRKGAKPDLGGVGNLVTFGDVCLPAAGITE